MGLGKSFKKAFKKVRKVAAKFDLGHQVGKKLGLPDPSGDALYGSDKALSPAEQSAADQAKLAQAQRDQEAQLAAQRTAMQLNMTTDLARDNTATVVAGGSAMGFDSSTNLKKRRAGGSLSSTLGLG